MAIKYLDKITSGIPTTIIEGKDVSNVMLINPPSLPPFFLENKAVLDTASNSIKVYDESGNFSLEIDLNKADLTPVIEAIEAVDDRVDDTNSNVSDITLRIETNEGSITDINAEIVRVEGKLDNQILRIDSNVSEVGAVRSIAEAADTLSKANEARLDAIDPDEVGDLVQQIGDNKTDIAGVKSAQEIDQANISANIEDISGIKENIEALNLEISATNSIAGEAKEESEEAKGLAGSALAKANANEERLDDRDKDIEKLEAYLSGLEGRITEDEGLIEANSTLATEAKSDASDAKSAADSAQGTADKAKKIATSAQTEAALNTTNILALDGLTATQGARLDKQAAQTRIALDHSREARNVAANTAANLETTNLAMQEIGKTATDADFLSKNNERLLTIQDGQIKEIYGIAENNDVKIDSVNESLRETKERQAIVEDDVRVLKPQVKSNTDGLTQLAKSLQSQVTDQWRAINEDRGLIEKNRSNLAKTDTQVGNNTKGVKENKALSENNLGTLNEMKLANADRDELIGINKTTAEGAQATANQAKGLAETADGKAVTAKELAEANEGRIQSIETDFEDRVNPKLEDASNTADAALETAQNNSELILEERGRIDTLYETRVTAAEFQELEGIVDNHADHLERLDGEISDINLAGLLRNDTDIDVRSITSDGSGFIDELYIPPEDAVFEEGKPAPVGGRYQYFTKHTDGTYELLIDYDKTRMDVANKPIINLTNGSADHHAVNKSQLDAVEAKITQEAGLKPFNNTWFMDGYPMVGVPSIGYRADESGTRTTYEEFTTKILADNIQFVTQNDSGHYVDINYEGVDVNNLEIKNLKTSTTESSAATVGQVKSVEAKVDNIVIPPDLSSQVSTNTSNIESVTSTANSADQLSKTNAGLLENALLSDEYGWDVNNLNIYNVSRFSRTNNAVNSSGLSIGDIDVNLHADTVGITNSNSSTTYAVFSAGGLNLNNYPLTRMGSGGDNDSNAANIGDVKRIAGDSPDLDEYAKLNTDVIFHEVSATGVDFTDADDDVVIQQKQGKKVELKVGTTLNAELTDSGMKFGRDVNASSQNINNMGDINFSGNAALVGHAIGDLSILNLKKISRNDSNDANSVTLGGGFNTYKSNDHIFETNDGVNLLSLDTDGIHIKNTHEGSKGDTSIKVDSANQNTVYDNAGLVYFNTIDKDSGEKKRIFITGQNGSVTYDHAVRSKEGFTNGTATFNTNTDKAAFIDFRTDSEVKLGAHSQIKFTIAGKTPVVVKSDSLDFSSLDSTMKINHDHNIDVVVSGTTNVAFKSNGMKLLSAVDANGQTTNHSGDIHFNSGKKLYGSGAGNLQVRNTDAIYRGDGNGSNIQFDAEKDVKFTGDHIRWFHTDGTQYGGISKTGINLRDTTKIVGLPQGEDDTDATNLGHIKELISANGGGGGIEFKKVKKNVTGSPQYVYHNGDNHMYIEYTGNGGTVSLDTMRNNIADQVEDMVVLHNKTAYECSIRLFFNGSSVLHTVKPFSYIHGWANREIGEWVVTKMLDPSALPIPMVVPLSSLNVSADSDPRTVTKRIISAMPNNSICISNHTNNSGTSKYRFISRGDSKNPETTDSTAIIVKSTDGRATGLSTTKTSSGKAYSRVLDGSRGAWFTNDSSNSFSLAEDIDLDQYPEDQLFLTGDQGMMRSEVSEDGENSLVPIVGYNVPKQEQDIQALQAESESNKVITKIFKNESLVTIPYTQEHPVVEVFVLDGSETINGSGLTIIDDDTHKYSGVYNTVGSVSLYDNKWTTFSYHNAYKHSSENYYVVFDQSLSSWVLLDTEILHTSIGDDVGNTEKISLNHTGLLPESFGNYVITLSIDDVSSLEFIKAEANTRIDTVAKTVIVDFGISKPSGKIVIK